LKPIFSQKDTRNVKLKPIEILSAAKAKNGPGVVQTAQKVKRIKVQASDISRAEDVFEEPVTVELLQNSNVYEDSNHSSPLLEPTESSPEAEVKEMDQEREVEERGEEEEGKLGNGKDSEESLEGSKGDIKRFKFSQYEVGELWRKFKRLLKKGQFCEGYHWVLYRVWRKAMVRGVRCIEDKCILRVKSALLIQKYWKMFRVRKDWDKIKWAVGVLQGYWKVCRPQRKFLLAAKTIAKLLTPLYRY